MLQHQIHIHNRRLYSLHSEHSRFVLFIWHFMEVCGSQNFSCGNSPYVLERTFTGNHYKSQLWIGSFFSCCECTACEWKATLSSQPSWTCTLYKINDSIRAKDVPQVWTPTTQFHSLWSYKSNLVYVWQYRSWNMSRKGTDTSSTEKSANFDICCDV